MLFMQDHTSITCTFCMYKQITIMYSKFMYFKNFKFYRHIHFASVQRVGSIPYKHMVDYCSTMSQCCYFNFLSNTLK